jgi:hypothetical protein
MLNVDTGGSGKKLKIIYGGIYRCSISSSVEISEMSSGFYIQRLNVNGASNDKLSFAAPVAGSLGCGADTKFIQFSPDDIVTCEIQTPEGTIVNFINYGLTVEKVGSDNEIGN